MRWQHERRAAGRGALLLLRAGEDNGHNDGEQRAQHLRDHAQVGDIPLLRRGPPGAPGGARPADGEEVQQDKDLQGQPLEPLHERGGPLPLRVEVDLVGVVRPGRGQGVQLASFRLASNVFVYAPKTRLLRGVVGAEAEAPRRSSCRTTRDRGTRGRPPCRIRST